MSDQEQPRRKLLHRAKVFLPVLSMVGVGFAMAGDMWWGLSAEIASQAITGFMVLGASGAAAAAGHDSMEAYAKRPR